MGLILHPDIRLRKDKKRIVIYSQSSFTQAISNISFIHSAYGILLAMFDGEKTYEQVLQDFCVLINQEYNAKTHGLIEKQLRAIAEDLLHTEHLLVECSELPGEQQVPRYQSHELLIPSSNVDLDYHNMRLDFPVSITYDVTTQCTMQCQYCYHPRYEMEEYISLERLDQLFDECKRKGCEAVYLTGGDPFDRPDLIEILAILSAKRLPYFLSTKSYLDHETCRRLKEEGGLSAMQISLDAADPAMASFLTGMGVDFFPRTVQTIRNLQEAGIKVGIKSVMTGYNIDQLEQLLELCKDLAIKRVQISQYRRSIWHHNDDLFATGEQLEKANQVLMKWREAEHPFILESNAFKPQVISRCGNDGENIFEERGTCTICRSNLVMLPNGEVIQCEQLPYTTETILGDLRQQSLEELWSSEKVLAFINPPERSHYPEHTPCSSCKEEDYQICHKRYGICLQDSFMYYQNLTSPDIRCKRADVFDLRLL